MNVESIGQRGIEPYVAETRLAAEQSVPAVTKGAGKVEKKDDVSISDAARELQEAQRAVEGAPDVRQDKVAALAEQIQQGTYKVPEESLVERLLSWFKAG